MIRAMSEMVEQELDRYIGEMVREAIRSVLETSLINGVNMKQVVFNEVKKRITKQRVTELISDCQFMSPKEDDLVRPGHQFKIPFADGD